MPAKILVVEDNADSREMLETVLSAEGYTVLLAEDGQAGIDLVQADPPDLIITDIEMPNLNGLEMLRRLRQRPDWRLVPVLVISAYGSGKLSEAIKIGASGTMRKPLKLSALSNLVRLLLTS